MTKKFGFNSLPSELKASSLDWVYTEDAFNLTWTSKALRSYILKHGPFNKNLKWMRVITDSIGNFNGKMKADRITVEIRVAAMDGRNDFHRFDSRAEHQEYTDFMIDEKNAFFFRNQRSCVNYSIKHRMLRNFYSRSFGDDDEELDGEQPTSTTEPRFDLADFVPPGCVELNTNLPFVRDLARWESLKLSSYEVFTQSCFYQLKAGAGLVESLMYDLQDVGTWDMDMIVLENWQGLCFMAEKLIQEPVNDKIHLGLKCLASSNRDSAIRGFEAVCRPFPSSGCQSLDINSVLGVFALSFVGLIQDDTVIEACCFQTPAPFEQTCYYAVSLVHLDDNYYSQLFTKTTRHSNSPR